MQKSWRSLGVGATGVLCSHHGLKESQPNKPTAKNWKNKYDITAYFSSILFGFIPAEGYFCTQHGDDLLHLASKTRWVKLFLFRFLCYFFPQYVK
jgi:hypothetical protein